MLGIIFLNFIYLWLCWVFVSVRGLSLVVASGGHSSSRCAGLSLSRPLPLRSTDSRRAGSVVVAHGPIRSAACGVFPDQGSNPCPLHWQADSQPLHHQGSPCNQVFLQFHFLNNWDHQIIKLIQWLSDFYSLYNPLALLFMSWPSVPGTLGLQLGWWGKHILSWPHLLLINIQKCVWMLGLPGRQSENYWENG